MQKILVKVIIILILARPSWTLSCYYCTESQACDNGKAQPSTCHLEAQVQLSKSNAAPNIFAPSSGEKNCGLFASKGDQFLDPRGVACVTMSWKSGGAEYTTRSCRAAFVGGTGICNHIEKECTKLNRKLLSCNTCDKNFCNIIPISQLPTRPPAAITAIATRPTRFPVVESIMGLAEKEPPIIPGNKSIKCFGCTSTQECYDPINKPRMPSTCSLSFTFNTNRNAKGNQLPKSGWSYYTACGLDQSSVSVDESKYGLACILLVAKVKGVPYTTRSCQPRYKGYTEICTYIQNKCKSYESEVVSCTACFTNYCNKAKTEGPPLAKPESSQSDEPLKCYRCSGKVACGDQIDGRSYSDTCEIPFVYGRTDNQSFDSVANSDDIDCGLMTRGSIKGEGAPVCITYTTHVKDLLYTTRGCAKLFANDEYVCEYVKRKCGVKYVSCEICHTKYCNVFGMTTNGDRLSKFDFPYSSYIFVIVFFFFVELFLINV